MSEEGFRVRDRRRFDEEGVEREDAADDTREPAPADAERHVPPASATLPSIDFSTFVLSLGTSGMVHLGEAPGPDDRSSRDLPLAKQTIDIIALLQEKTAGNLSETEDRLVAQLLYDLRLRYVAASGK